MIKGIFSEPEAKAILRIPVSSMELKDRLIWNSTTFGLYSVSSGYKIAKLRKQQAKGDEGSCIRKGEEEEELWKKVWNLDIKKKTQHFI